MLGLPPWAWVIIGTLVLIIVVIRTFYARWRRMCRCIRDEITELARSRHPEFVVVREEMGNLVVRDPGGAERTWEMAEIYTAVAQLPGMGSDPRARQKVYEQAADAFFPPPPEPPGPLTMSMHGDRLRPQLLTQAAFDELPDRGGIVRTPLPELGLVVVYTLDRMREPRYLTERDSRDLGLDLEALHRSALDNLRRDFPQEMVKTAASNKQGSAVRFRDGFDAARLLIVPEYLEPDQEVIALIPHRDLMVLLPAETRNDPAKLHEGMSMLDCDHPCLLEQPVLITHNGYRAV